MRTSSRTLPRALLPLLLSACAHTPPVPSSRAACEALAGRSVGDATVTRATLVAALDTLPEYCQVLGTLPPALDFELRLPSAWNGRTVYGGGGGFDGVIFPGDEYTEQGYASIASNGGHAGTPLEGAFALDPLKRDDFTMMSVHRVLPVAQALIRERYGRASQRTWFEGCSNGGREGLIAAQRWPEDFDGIIARAPGYNFTELMLTFHHHAQQLARPGALPSDAKLARLGQAELDACDAKDGLADGILAHPVCDFDPGVLQCPGDTRADCLTPEEVASARMLAAPYLVVGRRYHEGSPPGGALEPGGWAIWRTQEGGVETSAGALFAREFIRYFITRQPTLDPRAFQLTDWQRRADIVSSELSANGVSLERFRAHGGKLILWHGSADGVISVRGTAAYYAQLVETAGGQREADSFVEYFPAPGVHHCGGGVGADRVNLLPALEAWVERGVPPSQAGLVATRREATGAPGLSRPLCKAPLYPRYDGKGDPAQATSFSCVAP
jgi:hypothetical protein